MYTWKSMRMSTGVRLSVLLCLKVEWWNTIKMLDTRLISSVPNEEMDWCMVLPAQGLWGDLRSCDQSEPGASNPRCCMAGQACGVGMCLCQLWTGLFWCLLGLGAVFLLQHWTQNSASCLALLSNAHGFDSYGVLFVLSVKRNEEWP